MSEPRRTTASAWSLSQGRARRLLGCALIVVACFVAFGPALPGDFVWDDDTHLLDNPVLGENGLSRAWASTELPNYWPITWTSYWLEYQLWGLDPLGYHVVNVVLHAASALLVWGILLRLGVPYPWLVALVFAVHPLNVESVAWITQRKNVLSFFFFSLSLLFYLRFESRRSEGSYLVALASYLAAMLSKGAAAPLPAVLLLFTWWRRGTVTRRDLWNLVPFAVVAVFMSALEILFQYEVAIADDVVREGGFFSRLAGAGWVVWFYLYKALLPVGLNFVYPRWHIDPSAPLAWLPTVGVVAVVLVAWWGRRGWGRPVFLGLAYYLLMLSPVLGFFDIYFMRFSYVADHYQYLALVGLVALVVGGLGRLLVDRGRIPRWILVGVASITVVFLGAASAVQSASYRDAERLWRDTIAKNPDAFLAHYNLANLLQAEGRLDQALHHYGEALRIHPEDPLALTNLAKIHEDQQRPALALGLYRRALEVDPQSVEANNNLATLLQGMGRSEAALAYYRAALRGDPDSATVNYNLALLLERMGRIEQSIVYYRRAAELDPESELARLGLARALAERARRGEVR